MRMMPMDGAAAIAGAGAGVPRAKLLRRVIMGKGACLAAESSSGEALCPAAASGQQESSSGAPNQDRSARRELEPNCTNAASFLANAC